MTKYLGLGCVALLAVVGPATAAGNDSVGVSTSVAALCTLTTHLSAVETIDPPYPGEHNLGTLGYTCNFGSELQYPSLKIQAPGGTALVNTTDAHTVQYQVKWAVPQIGPAVYYTSAPPTTGNFQFPGDQGLVPNIEQTGFVTINLLADLTHAGTYSDVLIFSVSP